jgi:hypothetical protein
MAVVAGLVLASGCPTASWRQPSRRSSDEGSSSLGHSMAWNALARPVPTLKRGSRPVTWPRGVKANRKTCAAASLRSRMRTAKPSMAVWTRQWDESQCCPITCASSRHRRASSGCAAASAIRAAASSLRTALSAISSFMGCIYNHEATRGSSVASPRRSHRCR